MPLRRFFPRTLVAIAATFLSGCLTSEVKDFVRDTNYQMVLAQTGGDPASALQTNPIKSGTASSLDELEAFIAQHPENHRMVAALRLRQAVGYLNTHSLNLARAAFAQIPDPDTNLTTARDLAIFTNRENLMWWYAQAAADPYVFYDQERARARNVIESFQSATTSLSGAPDVRDYFLESAAWIALKLGVISQPYDATRVAGEPSSKETIAHGMDGFAAVFTPEERQHVQDGKLAQQTVKGETVPNPNPKPFDLSTRRIFRARELLKNLAEVTSSWPAADRPTLGVPEFQACYESFLGGQ